MRAKVEEVTYIPFPPHRERHLVLYTVAVSFPTQISPSGPLPTVTTQCLRRGSLPRRALGPSRLITLREICRYEASRVLHHSCIALAPQPKSPRMELWSKAFAPSTHIPERRSLPLKKEIQAAPRQCPTSYLFVQNIASRLKNT